MSPCVQFVNHAFVVGVAMDVETPWTRFRSIGQSDSNTVLSTVVSDFRNEWT